LGAVRAATSDAMLFSTIDDMSCSTPAARLPRSRVVHSENRDLGVRGLGAAPSHRHRGFRVAHVDQELGTDPGDVVIGGDVDGAQPVP